MAAGSPILAFLPEQENCYTYGKTDVDPFSLNEVLAQVAGPVARPTGVTTAAGVTVCRSQTSGNFWACYDGDDAPYEGSFLVEFSATSGEPTNTNVTSAVVTSDTSSALEANPSQGCHNPRRSVHQIASAASAAVNVTQNPQTKTGTSGYWNNFHVGVISSNAIATRRTRATRTSPSTPAAASAGSGRCQNVCTVRTESFRRLLCCESLARRRSWQAACPLGRESRWRTEAL